jgi:predicted TPR repeat methyltransferase
MNAVVQSRDRWENEYESGAWSRLHSSHEFAHYTLVASYLQRHGRPFRLLDVGCGEGVILKFLNRSLVESYTGVDIAQAALDKIPLKRSQDRMICSQLETYSPEGRWDVILFNEVLYYTADPVAQFRKFSGSLNANGFYVISMFKKRNPFAWNNRCIRRIQRHLHEEKYRIDDAVRLAKSDNSATWEIMVVRPPGAEV